MENQGQRQCTKVESYQSTPKAGGEEEALRHRFWCEATGEHFFVEAGNGGQDGH